MKTLVIYHSADLDGLCSGAVAKLKYPDAELIGYDYHQPFNWDIIPLDDCQVFMLDVSMSMTDMMRIRDLTFGRFTWIDHHISAINDFNATTAAEGQPVCKSYLRNGNAACELAWEYFFPDDPMPIGVRLLGEYDTWRNADKDRWWNQILPFQYGCRLIYPTAEHIYSHMKEIADQGWTEATIESGRTILSYQRQQNERACWAAFETVFEGLPAVCLNIGGANSQMFDSVYNPERHKLMIPFSYNGSGWKASLYTTHEDVDCSEIAKRYGGGGHRKAAGFKIDGPVAPFTGVRVNKK